MHSFLKSVGFSVSGNPGEIEEIIRTTILKAKYRKEVKLKRGGKLIEYIRFTTEDSGIIVVGEEDDEKKFHYKYYFPFGVSAGDINPEDEFYINKKVDSDAYTAMCDDPRVGMSLIFYVVNVVDFLKFYKGEKRLENKAAQFVGLADTGKVILPTLVHVENSERQKKENYKKNKLVAEAKKGNQEAIENLTLDDITRYAIISQRIQKEDILSIVETSIVPYGSESDMYKITGNIEAVKKLENSETGEEIWHMTINVDEIPMNVYINAKDLMGEPTPGRRFRGNVWLQAQLLDLKEKGIPKG